MKNKTIKQTTYRYAVSGDLILELNNEVSNIPFLIDVLLHNEPELRNETSLLKNSATIIIDRIKTQTWQFNASLEELKEALRLVAQTIGTSGILGDQNFKVNINLRKDPVLVEQVEQSQTVEVFTYEDENPLNEALAKKMDKAIKLEAQQVAMELISMTISSMYVLSNMEDVPEQKLIEEMSPEEFTEHLLGTLATTAIED